jgi:hypothetical protein
MDSVRFAPGLRAHLFNWALAASMRPAFATRRACISMKRESALFDVLWVAGILILGAVVALVTWGVEKL